MLWEWSAVNDGRHASTSPSDPGAPAETEEAREGRVRAAYADALQLHATGRATLACDAYHALAAELGERCSGRPHLDHGDRERPRKRQRHSNSRKEPEWARVIRYAVHRNMGDLLMESRKPAAAMDAYCIALDNDPGDMTVWLRAGRAAIACGHWHIARRALEQALRRRPGHWLCEEELRKVILAIGDGDEDVRDGKAIREKAGTQSANTALLTSVSAMLGDRYGQVRIAREGETARAAEPDCAEMTEPTWNALVLTLGAVLKRRMDSKQTPVSAQVGSLLAVRLRLEDDSHETKKSIDSASPTCTEQTVERNIDAERQSAVPARDAAAADVGSVTAVKVEQNDEVTEAASLQVEDSSVGAAGREEASSAPLPMTRDDDAATSPTKVEAHADGGKGSGTVSNQPAENAVAAKSKPPELRKSKRQQELGREQRREHVRSRSTTLKDEETLAYGSQLAEQMRALIPSVLIPSRDDAAASRTQPHELGSNPESDTRQGISLRTHARELKPAIVNTTWNRATSEADEAAEVTAFLRDASDRNGGPIDLLHRVLAVLLAKRSTQYMSQLARCWLLLQPHFSAAVPGSASATAFVIESLLVSGDKAGKIKRSCFQESKRLVSILPVVCSDLCAVSEAASLETLSSQARTHWISGQVADRILEMRSAYKHTLLCIDALRCLRGMGLSTLPSETGPLLAGLDADEALLMVQQARDLFYCAGELEQASTHLSKARKHQDMSQAAQAIQTLAVAVQAIATSLDFDSAHPSRSRTHGDGERVHGAEVSTKNEKSRLSGHPPAETALPEPGSKAMVTINSQLDVFLNACTFCGDSAGELAALAIKIKLLTLQYAQKVSDASSEAKAAVDAQENIAEPLEHAAALLLSTIVADLRRFVAVVKRVATLKSAEVSNGPSGWEPVVAISLAAKALVGAADVLQARIPAVAMSIGAPLELNASQKNQRLAFTRAMLGFVRCVSYIRHCRIIRGEEDLSIQRTQSPTDHTLSAIYLALRVLASRGCLREEGTSGALIRLYLTCLTQKLSEIAVTHSRSTTLRTKKVTTEVSTFVAGEREVSANEQTEVPSGTEVLSDALEALQPPLAVAAAGHEQAPSERDWRDVRVVRKELAQCYRCLYKLPDLEALCSGAAAEDSRWLLEACSLSRRMGLSFAGDGAQLKLTMDMESCRGAFGFNRKYLFESLTCQWRDGKKSRRARDIIAELAETLPSDFPAGVPCVPLPVLDAVVSLGLESGRSAVLTLKSDWERAVSKADRERPPALSAVTATQISRMYYEVYILHVMTILATYESEFKKQRVVERRKSPKEVVERLIVAASNDCVGALRARPWSPGAWILLGRVFLEVADVALDERAVASSLFGMCRTEDLASGDLGDPAVGILGRAEGCFRLAEALARERWEPGPVPLHDEGSNEELLDAEAFDMTRASNDAGVTSAEVSFELFSQFGIHETSSGGARSIRAAAQLGKASVLIMRLREERYRARHWTTSTVIPRPLSRASEKYPSGIVKLASDANRSLERGMRLAFPECSAARPGESGSCAVMLDSRAVGDDSRQTGDEDLSALPQDQGELDAEPQVDALSSNLWYYLLMRAKLARKRGETPEVYLQLFADAANENRRVRLQDTEKPDIEPFYQLHAARMKALLEHDGSDWHGLSKLLHRFAFSEVKRAVEKGTSRAAVEDIVNTAAASDASARRSVAQDIMKAMAHCRHQKASHAYSEFYFKAVYARVLLLWKVFDDRAAAAEELNSMFRVEAAAKATDAGADGSHRGYFFTIWNYRHTDTGCEVAIETERKYLRWRDKLLGLLNSLLLEAHDARRLFGVISRLKRRHPDDLPIDGAALDDLIMSHARVASESVSTVALKAEEVPTVALSERTLKNAWDVFVEAVRLGQGVKRVGLQLERNPDTSEGSQALLKSGRPWCVIPAALSLHLEHIRLQAAIESKAIDHAGLPRVPGDGGPSDDVPSHVLSALAPTIRFCLDRWPIDLKMAKVVRRRADDYAAGGSRAARAREKVANNRPAGEESASATAAGVVEVVEAPPG